MCVQCKGEGYIVVYNNVCLIYGWRNFYRVNWCVSEVQSEGKVIVQYSVSELQGKGNITVYVDVCPN